LTQETRKPIGNITPAWSKNHAALNVKDEGLIGRRGNVKKREEDPIIKDADLMPLRNVWNIMKLPAMGPCATFAEVLGFQ